ncbi:MFS transporter [Clostridium sp. 'deep sea']|uniref:MFS transporter n=1 Tax=Clostridium sp. 'deep sea' TaxID=2779445 RepID=UPI0018966AD1|nr:MFS transporter [Clostridium sp. 'deep sea']QOR35531.1 MFS transporter [Clostridium sp. 'deep sea']
MTNNSKKIYFRHRFFTSFAFSMIFSVTSIYYIDKIGLNPLQLVMVGTVLEISYFLFEVPTGIVADIYSRKLSIIIGLILTGLGFIIEGAIPLFFTVIISQILWGIGATFLSGAVEAWITDEVGVDNVQHLFLTGAQFSQLAALLGIIASMLLGYVSLQLPIVCGGLIFIVLVLHHIYFLQEANFVPLLNENRESYRSLYVTFIKGLQFIKQKRVLLLSIIITLFYGLYSEGIDRLWNMHFLNNIKLPLIFNLKPVLWFGIINICSMLIMIFITSKIKNKLLDSNNSQQINMIIVLNALLVISILTFAFVTNFYLGVLAVWSIKVLRKVNRPILSAFINQHIESSVRATVLSTISQFDAFGQILGGPIIGFIALKISVSFALAFSALILLPVVFIFIQLKN